MPSKIQWTDETWNPVTGCTPISEGCQKCYAKRMASRLQGRFGYPSDDPFKVTFHEDRLQEIGRWKKPRRIFVCSMGDLFHADVEDWMLTTIFSAMFAFDGTMGRPKHTFMLLTKRPERMREWIEKSLPYGIPDHIWLGVTAENQQRADERIPRLLTIPAAVHFVSVEPMLGPVDLDRVAIPQGFIQAHGGILPGANWVICGAETGIGARPMDREWARSLMHNCDKSKVPFFMKAMSKKEPIPADLNRKEWPK